MSKKISTQTKLVPEHWDWFDCEKESSLCGVVDPNVMGHIADDSVYNQAVESYKARVPLWLSKTGATDDMNDKKK